MNLMIVLPSGSRSSGFMGFSVRSISPAEAVSGAG
jgi:hypothetical protein